MDRTAYLAPSVAARIQRARVEQRDVRAIRRSLRTRLLGTTDCIRHDCWHGRTPLGKADNASEPDIRAAIPCPSLLIEFIQLYCCDTVRGGNSRAAIASLDFIGSTRPVRIRFRGKVRKSPR
jgi:hypothetical protein